MTHLLHVRNDAYWCGKCLRNIYGLDITLLESIGNKLTFPNCFQLQGYCASNEWLKPYTCSENVCVKCERNPCASSDAGDTSEWVLLKDGSCAELGRNHRSCKTSREDDVVRFSQFQIYPSCEHHEPLPKFGLDLGGIGVPPSKCPQGYAKTATGHCSPPFEF